MIASSVPSRSWLVLCAALALLGGCRDCGTPALDPPPRARPDLGLDLDLSPVGPSAARVLRGPYLQLATERSVVIRWRTDRPEVGRVRFGPPQGLPTRFADEPAATTEHAVTLDGLTPATAYAYSIGTPTQVLAGADAHHRFRTAPGKGAAGPTRIWVLGDSGTANQDAQAVRDAFAGFTRERGADLILMLGDNAYNSGTDEEYQAAVFDLYPSWLRTTPLWPALGNHDGLSADSATQSGPYFDIFTLPRRGEAGGAPSGTEAYYSFDHGDIHFISLDSYETSRAADGAMLRWLRADLLANTARWTVAFWHHPPYSKGTHDSDTEIEMVEMRTNALPLLEQHGVDVVLTGHSHAYERSFLLDGHYGHSSTLTPAMKKDPGSGREDKGAPYRKATLGPAAHEGAVYVVAGSSGQIGGGALDHPAMYLSLNQLGSLVIDVDPDRLDARFLNSEGAVTDAFTVRKGPPR